MMNGGAVLSVAPALALRPVKLKEESTGYYHRDYDPDGFSANELQNRHVVPDGPLRRSGFRRRVKQILKRR